MEKTRRLKTFSIVALIVAVLGLTIAFAALSKTLTINGAGTVDAANWDIHFKNISEASLTGKATTTGTPVLADNGATINDMKVSLKEPGDKVVYTVDIENSGDINAEIDSITLPTFTTAQSNILDFKAVYTSNNKEISEGDILESKEVKNVTITIMYKDITDESLLPSEGITINLNYALHFVQTDLSSGSSSHGSKPGTQEVKTYNVGDKFCLDGESECFYVIEDNGNTVTALAEYKINTSTYKQEYVTSKGGDKYNNIAAFSSSAYWSSNVTEYPSFVYNENSSLYRPLENYSNYLKDTFGKESISATLLSYEQAINLGCTGPGNGTCASAPSWFNSVYYWLGSASSSSSIYFIDNAWFGNASPTFSGSYSGGYGLRPVITIAKSEL